MLQEMVPDLLRARTPGRMDLGVWPFNKRPTLHVFDPKVEIQSLDLPSPWKVRDCVTAHEAGRAGLTCAPWDVIIVEELMLVGKQEMVALNQAISVSRRGTHSRGPTIIGTTQRPVNMPVNFRALPDYWIAGRITERSDLKAIAEVAGEDFARTLPRLDIGQWEVLKL